VDGPYLADFPRDFFDSFCLEIISDCKHSETPFMATNQQPFFANEFQGGHSRSYADAGHEFVESCVPDINITIAATSCEDF